MKLLLISGHGATDPGAISKIGGTLYREADEARRVTAALKQALEGYCDVTIYPTTRNAYADYKSGALSGIAGFSAYDYVLEIHFNAFSPGASDNKTKGVECYVPVAAESDATEKAICNAVSSCGMTNRGVKRYNWAVISKARQSGVNSALLEICFIDDPDDMAVYIARFQTIIDAIASAIISEYGLKKGETPVTYEQFKAFMEKYEAEKAAQLPGSWSKEAREWCEANGYIQDGRWKDNVTREELAEILKRIVGVR